MLPFRKNIIIFIIEFLCTVLLQTVYAISEYGMQRALMTLVGLIPVFLVFLLSMHIEKETFVVRCLYISAIPSLYYMSYATSTQGMLVFVFLATATTIALFLIQQIMIEYFALTLIILILMEIFQADVVNAFFDQSQYVAYITMYAFAGVALVFTSYSVDRYKKEMEEKNEIAQEALEAKSNFLANMSHEIRTPMNAIYGMAELLEEQGYGGEQREYVTTIKRSSENLLSIINEILDFSKVDSGKMEITEEPYDFNEMLQDVVTIIEFRMRDKNIVLQLEIDSNIPRILIGDETRVRQILINLLNNAVKFTNQGTILLRIEWLDESKIYNIEQGRMTIHVIDTGIGIAAENIPKLFSAFGQIDTKKNRNVEGTGLGLAICKALTDAMGGEISVRSILGKGSDFCVILPQHIFDVSPSGFQARHIETMYAQKVYQADFTAPTARVLIVDDNRVNLQVAKELMRIYGIDAATAESGKEAINRIERHLVTYDIVFMDHMMPYMDGVEATRQIRQMNDAYARKVPIVALTANVIKGVETQFREAGMNDYLPKPIRIEQLGEILKRWLPERKVFPAGTSMEEIEWQESLIRWEDLTDNEKLAKLEGLDTATGLRNCAGNVPAYFELLRTYSVSNLLSLLNDFYEKEDLENYAVTAHSIKGASLNVGALDVADIAYNLECAGKRGDITYIWDHHEELVKEYGTVLTRLRKIFAPRV